ASPGADIIARCRGGGKRNRPCPGRAEKIFTAPRRAERRFAAPAISEAEAAPATISARRDSYQGGNLIALPRTSFGSSTGKAPVVGRGLEQKPAPLSEKSRTGTTTGGLLPRARRV